MIGETMLESGFIILSKRLYSYFWNYMCMPKFSLLYSIVFEKVNTCVEFVQLEEQACRSFFVLFIDKLLLARQLT